MLGYAWVYEHWRLVEFADGSPWPWVIAFFGIDDKQVTISPKGVVTAR